MLKKWLLVLCVLLPAVVHSQTVATPTVIRTDPIFTGKSTVIWPEVYDSSRVVVTMCAQVRRNGSTITKVCRTKTTSWIRHIDSTLIISKIIVSPPLNGTMLVGETGRACGFLQFANGALAMRERDSAFCGTRYNALIPTASLPSARQQIWADSSCIHWRVVDSGDAPTGCEAGTYERFSNRVSRSKTSR